MDWLGNWDDLVHGTAVFSVAVPALVTAALIAKLPVRWWWLAAAAALAVPFLWFFGWAQFPPASSEDAALTGLAAATGAIALESVLRLRWELRWVLRFLLFFGLIWSVYPGWLTSERGMQRQMGVSAGLAMLIAVWAGIIEFGTYRERPEGEGQRNGLMLVALVPPAAGMAVLLQLGGALRFGQSAGALAAVFSAAALVQLARKGEGSGVERLGAVWGMLFGLLACSGWLFAELRYGLAALLFTAPLASALTRWAPLPRKYPWQEVLWDALASGLAVVIPLVVAVAEYLGDAAGYEGY
jgi:hypothetical protein